MRRLLALAALFGLMGCAYGGRPLADISPAGSKRSPAPQAFDVCYANGCKKQKHVSLAAAEWTPLARLFAQPPANARGERARIVRALQMVEMTVGHKTGLDADEPGSFAGVGKVNQQDCVDEMTNVATQLKIFEGQGFLKFHTPGRRVTSSFLGPRGPWSHTVATIVETATGKEYVIDSWMQPFGALPYVMPIEDWRAGKALAYAY